LPFGRVAGMASLELSELGEKYEKAGVVREMLRSDGYACFIHRECMC